jgi:hypothetical protein
LLHDGALLDCWYGRVGERGLQIRMLLEQRRKTGELLLCLRGSSALA